jgi:hypothetical protein
MNKQHEQERAAVNSAVLKLQKNGWRVLAVDDGEDIERIDQGLSATKQRHQAVDAADATDWSTIHLKNSSKERASLFIVWGNDPEYVISDITASSDAVLGQVEEVLK